MSGWVLRDINSPLRTLVGTLTEVYNSDGLVGDGDTNVKIVPVPDEPNTTLLKNRKGVDNRDGTIECEVNVTEDGDARSHYESWVSSMIGAEVTAKGVYVDDEGHHDKTEIHPVDLIVARVNGSALPTDWIADVAAQHHLQVGIGLFAYRYAAASDDRDGVAWGAPPLAKQTRTTSVTLPFPSRPGSTRFPIAGTTTPQVERRSGGARHAGSHIDMTVTGDTASAELVVTVKAVDHGGPGFDLGELALYWVRSTPPVSPS